MKIVINEDKQFAEPEIIINCASLTPELLGLISSAQAIDKKIVGQKDKRSYILNVEDVYYFESLERKTFLYLADKVLETPLKLYEIEERFSAIGFFRASKSLVVNLLEVKAVLPQLDGRIELTLNNDERLIVSRQYASALKVKLGMR